MKIWTFLFMFAFLPGLLASSGPQPETLHSGQRHASNEVDFAALMEGVKERHRNGHVIRTRSQWPRHLPIAVEIAPFGWLESPVLDRLVQIEFADCHFERFATGTARNPVRSVRPNALPWGADRTHEISPTCVDDNGNLLVSVRLSGARTGPAMPYETLALEVNIVDSIDEILVPVTEEDLIKRIVSQFSVELLAHGPWEQRHGSAVIGVRVPIDLPSNLAVALRIELLVAEEVVATARWCATRSHYHRIRANLVDRGFVTHFNPVQTNIPLHELRDRVQHKPLKARISPDPEYALRDFENDRYLHWEEPFEVEVDTSALDAD